MDKVYFQKLIYSGSSVTKDSVKETGADFSVYPQEVPFIMQAEMKESAKRDWHDEDGIDVFYGNPQPAIKDYDLEIECMAKSKTISDLRGIVNSFISYLRGDDGKGNVFAIFDTHCDAGRRNIRFMEYEDQSFYNFDSDDEKFISFKIKMHVDDPRTEVSLVSENDKVTDLKI